MGTHRTNMAIPSEKKLTRVPARIQLDIATVMKMSSKQTFAVMSKIREAATTFVLEYC